MDIKKSREEYRHGKSIYDMNLRVVYYARVSTDSDVQLNSLENQKKYFEDYINDIKSWKLVGKYIDEGISGTRVKNRASFLEMIRDGTEGLFDMIITKEVSRFARNTIDSIKYTSYLLKHGVIVCFLNDNLNTIDEACEFRLTIMSSIAQDEVRKLSQRVKFGMARSVKDGKVLGGGNITGYYKKNGKLFINEREAKMIRMLFNLYASGEYGYKKIANILYENGFKNTKGEKWSDRVLNRIITNPKYKGYYCGNKSFVEDYKTHKRVFVPEYDWLLYKDENIPAIVSEEVWNEANKVHDKRRKDYSKILNCIKHYDKKYVFTGKLICKEHNVSFIRKCHGNRYNNPVWQCINYHREGLNGCITPTIYESKLNEIINNRISIFSDLFKRICKELLEDYKNIINSKDEEKIINSRIKRIEKFKEKLLELSIEGYISKEEYKYKKELYNEELKRLHDSFNNLERTNNNKILDNINKYLNSIDNEVLIDILINKIYVSKINNDRNNINLEIIYNYNLFKESINVSTI